ncbi:hypothetical protein NQD34_009604 [Periophthalmus magnuspinnatus]|nr:hypothetical protein NQD34_009604 [Periophthalmus magnuspinnatus]
MFHMTCAIFWVSVYIYGSIREGMAVIYIISSSERVENTQCTTIHAIFAFYLLRPYVQKQKNCAPLCPPPFTMQCHASGCLIFYSPDTGAAPSASRVLTYDLWQAINKVPDPPPLQQPDLHLLDIRTFVVAPCNKLIKGNLKMIND